MPPNDTPEKMRIEIGARMRDARNALGMTISELARVMGTNRQTIQFYERGANLPVAAALPAWCKALNIDANYLLGVGPVPTAPAATLEPSLAKLAQLWSELSATERKMLTKKAADLVAARESPSPAKKSGRRRAA